MERAIFVSRKVFSNKKLRSKLTNNYWKNAMGEVYDSWVIKDWKNGLIVGNITILPDFMNRDISSNPKEIAEMIYDLDKKGITVAISLDIPMKTIQCIKNELDKLNRKRNELIILDLEIVRMTATSN